METQAPTALHPSGSRPKQVVLEGDHRLDCTL